MKRKYLASVPVALCLWISSSLIVFMISCTPEIKTAEKPNILFMFTDDQRADAIGCSGNTYIRTPNIDKLAAEGVRFTNNYIMGGSVPAVCAPSRAMLMSGKNLFHIYKNIDLDGITTMPQYFKLHGYVTFGTGKWHNGGASFERSFDRGENVFLGGMCDHFKVPCRELNENKKLGPPVSKGYSTDVFTDAVLHFIRDYAGENHQQPFFAYVAFTAPHDPRSPREDYIGKYSPGAIPVPGNFMEYHPFAFDDMAIRDEMLAPWPRNPEVIQESIADYYSMIALVDEKIGEIVSALKQYGLFDNTIIVFSSDNGLSIGSHGLMGKQNLYEESIRVPLLISGPGIPVNSQSQAYTYLFDLFPTLCGLTGLPVPAGVDGKDISSVLNGETRNVRNSVFTAYRNTARAIRTGEWKLIRYPDRDYTQLFNLEKDPLEINSLAGLPENKDKIEVMTEALKKWQEETGDTVRLTADKILPLQYDPTKFERTPDQFQPEYTLRKYFNK